MSANKSIIVKIDGKQTKETIRDVINNELTGKEEVAAAEESSGTEIQTFAREYDSNFMLSGRPKQKQKQNKQNKFDMFKPILVAIISAIAIGSILGLIMLKIIVNFDNGLYSAPTIILPSGEEENDVQEKEEAESKSTNSSIYVIDSMSAFVLQGGVFSTRENAEAESAKFIEHGYSPIVWEKDGQFFLFVNLGLSKEDLQSDITVLMESGIEVYAKEWNTTEREIKLTQEEYEWHTLFQDSWKIALRNDNIDIETWSTLTETTSIQSGDVAGLISIIKEQVNELNSEDTKQVLLGLWQTYDSYLTDRLTNLE